MCKCVNENCNNDPFNSIDHVLATPDADFACNKECLKKFKEQRKRFFDNIADDTFYNNWWNE